MNIHQNLKQMGRVGYDQRIKEEDDEVSGFVRAETSSEEDSMESSSSCSSMSSSSDLTEDASSSSNGPLHDLSELMNHLPIKRGLSKFYEGKSQSFFSLATVKSIEDLQKKNWDAKGGNRMRQSKSSLGLFSPKATISKKATRKHSTLSSLSIKSFFAQQPQP